MILEEGIEQLKELILSENNKRKLNKNEFNQINSNKNKRIIGNSLRIFP